MVELSEAKAVFEQLFKDVKGRELSLAGREAINTQNKSFVYGEVVPDSFYEILKEARVNQNGVFYDLGSGTGKAVVLAHLLFAFPEAKGIEYIAPLYESSAETLRIYQEKIRPKLGAKVGDKKISFFLGDFLDFDLADASVIFMNSTCFQEDLMESLSQKLRELKPGTAIISLTKALKGPEFAVDKQQSYDFSWGKATVYFQHRL